MPLWRWLSVSSLDAPLVAVSWQLLLAHQLDLHLDSSSVFLLFVPIWLVYVADRVIDGRRLPALRSTTDRHRIHHELLPLLAVTWLGLLSVALCTSFLVLDSRQWMACLALLSLALIYLAAVHSPIGRRPDLAQRFTIERVAVKEVAVGMLFALGVALFPLLSISVSRVGQLWPIAPFAALCTTNCLLITAWEQGPRVPSATLAHRRATLTLAALVIASGAALALALFGVSPSFARETSWLFCLWLSALGLAVLHRFSANIPLESLRALADIVLMTPLVALVSS